jgi:hypothetical protein
MFQTKIGFSFFEDLKPELIWLALPSTKAFKDIVFRFIIEYSS